MERLNCKDHVTIFDFPLPGFTLAPGSRLLKVDEMQSPLRIQEAGGEEACFRLTREMADLPVTARFTVNGEPVSKARPRVTRSGHTYTPESSRQGEKRVAAAFTAAVPDYIPLEDTTYGVFALFFCGTRQRRDVDNMMKLILDALNARAWMDDSQVVEISGRKSLVPPDEARTEVVVYAVGKVQRFIGVCERCGDPFEVHGSFNSGKQRKRRFCSTGCAYGNRERDDPEASCRTCGEVYSRKGRSYSEYCSRTCASNPIYVKCTHCGKQFFRSKSYIRKRNFCSQQCRDSYMAVSRAKNARGVCETCGGPTSKKSYRQCASCFARPRFLKLLEITECGDSI